MSEINVVDDEEFMKQVRAKGEKKYIYDGEITLVVYLYNNHLYIDDVERK